MEGLGQGVARDEKRCKADGNNSLEALTQSTIARAVKKTQHRHILNMDIWYSLEKKLVDEMDAKTGMHSDH